MTAEQTNPLGDGGRIGVDEPLDGRPFHVISGVQQQGGLEPRRLSGVQEDSFAHRHRETPGQQIAEIEDRVEGGQYGILDARKTLPRDLIDPQEVAVPDHRDTGLAGLQHAGLSDG